MKPLVVLLGFFMLLSLCAAAQNESIMHATADTLLMSGTPTIQSFKSVSTLDPNKSAVYSAVFPGLGQMYNKQYWKLPIVYGGAILIGHFIKYNNDFYNEFRNAYIAETDNDESTINPFERFSEQALQLNAERFRRNRDYMAIIGVVFYLVQIVDAHVSAHLIEFDINDELALQPTYYPREQYFAQNLGMSLVLKLNK